MSESSEPKPEQQDLDTVAFLLRVWQLGTGFQPVIVIERGEGGLELLRRAFKDQHARVEDHDPGLTFLTRSLEPVHAPEGEAPRRIIWVEQPDFEPSAWRKTFAALNMNRERLREQMNAILILAGPPEVREISRTNGQDLASIATIRYFSGHHQLTAARTGFSWLHLSDFHFTADTAWAMRPPLVKLLGRLRDMPRPDLVFFTGDLAATGKRAEYEKVREFLHELGTAIRHDHRRNWFFVPGNHDVDRDQISRVDGSILRDIQNADDLELTQRDGQAMDLLGRRLNAFYGFTRAMLGPARAWRPETPWRADLADLEGLNVGVLQLNTAWAGGLSEDQGKLFIGGRQLRECLDLTAGADLRVALTHHPLDWLTAFDQEDTRRAFKDNGLTFLLHGHHHQLGSAASSTEGTADFLAFATQLNHVEAGGLSRFQFVDVDLNEGVARVQLFGCNESGEWRLDTGKDPDGILTLPLPTHGLQSNRAMDPNNLRRNYRKAVAAYHGTIRFMGLAEDAPNPNTAVEHVFVPLTLEPWQSEAKLTTTALAELLTKAGEPSRLVVLGDPGSGKSTLCKYLALAVAGETEIPVVGEPLPLVIPFREYVEAAALKPKLSLIDFLVDQAKTELGIALTQSNLESVLDVGHAVLVLDGLDEVGSAEKRERMRDRVQTFCDAWPKIPVFITSRIVGYKEAPMPEDGKTPFQTLKLTPFSDEELDQFVQRWYGVMIPDQPSERNRRTLQLMEGLKQTPAAQELARNPLLATLLALVHFYRLELPGERARLYQACLKTLLETWPARRGKSFKELDPELQVHYLSKLALEMQTFRSNKNDDDLSINKSAGGENVLITRHALQSRLERLLEDRYGTDAAAMATRWLQFLERDSGLLVEQTTGYLGFFHLTLLEYLAALGLCHDPGVDLPKVLLDLHDKGVWSEVCLLVVGHRALDDSFLTNLYGAFELSDDLSERVLENRCLFLLQCLLEEAAFEPPQMEAILTRAGEIALENPLYNCVKTINAILVHSKRHSIPAMTWLDKLVFSKQEKDLHLLCALIHDDQMIIQKLKERSDTPFVTKAVAGFFPRDVGHWSLQQLDSKAQLDWVMNITGTEEPLTSLALFQRKVQTAAMAMSVRVAICAAQQSYIASKNLSVLDVAMKDIYFCELKKTCPLKPKNVLLMNDAFNDVLCQSSFQDDSFLIKRFLCLVYSEGLTSGISDILLSLCVLGEVFGKFPPSEWVSSGESMVLEEFPQDLEYLMSDSFKVRFCEGSRIKHVDSWFSKNWFDPDAPEYFFAYSMIPCINRTGKLQYQWKPLRASVSNPSMSSKRLDWKGYQTLSIDKIENIYCICAGETLASMVASFGMEDSQKRSMKAWRVGRRTLLEIMPYLPWLQPDDSPGLQALYLAIGWSQASVTWSWPDDPRWVEMMKKEPEHWLPRAHWYMCYLLYKPNDPHYRKGYQDALDEGEVDKELPGYAALMPRLMNEPGAGADL